MSLHPSRHDWALHTHECIWMHASSFNHPGFIKDKEYPSGGLWVQHLPRAFNRVQNISQMCLKVLHSGEGGRRKRTSFSKVKFVHLLFLTPEWFTISVYRITPKAAVVQLKGQTLLKSALLLKPVPHLFIPKQLLLLTGALSITATPTSDIPHILPCTKHSKPPSGNTEEVTHIHTDPALNAPCTAEQQEKWTHRMRSKQVWKIREVKYS